MFMVVEVGFLIVKEILPYRLSAETPAATAVAQLT